MKIKFLKNIFLISGAFSLSTFLISCNTKKSQNSNDVPNNNNSNDVPNNNNKEVKINEFKLEINNDSLKAYITGNNLNNLDSYDFKIVNPKNEEITDFYKDTAASSNDSLILINNNLNKNKIMIGEYKIELKQNLEIYKKFQLLPEISNNNIQIIKNNFVNEGLFIPIKNFWLIKNNENQINFLNNDNYSMLNYFNKPEIFNNGIYISLKNEPEVINRFFVGQYLLKIEMDNFNIESNIFVIPSKENKPKIENINTQEIDWREDQSQNTIKVQNPIISTPSNNPNDSDWIIKLNGTNFSLAENINEKFIKIKFKMEDKDFKDYSEGEIEIKKIEISEDQKSMSLFFNKVDVNKFKKFNAEIIWMDQTIYKFDIYKFEPTYNFDISKHN